MIRPSGFTIAVLVLAAGVALASVDLFKLSRETLVVYTTPALRDFLEGFVAPQFRAADITPVYLSAGEQYNRLRMSAGHPEADLFLQASPLFLEKGFSSGYFLPFTVGRDGTIPDAFKSRNVTGGHVWYAFAWSPLVEVYSPTFSGPPDLASFNTTFGFPHPLLSNNGIYAVIFFENVSRSAGLRALAHTVVQPVNARANILGVADGDFALTLGYEAVTLFYANQGARVRFSLPALAGQSYVTPVIFSVGLVTGHPNPLASNLIEFLFSDTVQANLCAAYLRSVLASCPGPNGGISLPAPGAVALNYNWSNWSELEQVLPSYVIGG
jgi:ABC-type Fe3+ transport system substrate-binding protein